MNRRHINLLTPQFRLQLIIRTRLPRWLVVCGIVCVVALAAWQFKSRRLNNASDALALMESRSAPLRSMRIENQQMTSRLDELKSHQSLLTRLDDEQIPYRLMGLVSHGVRICDGGIRVQTLTLVRAKEVVPPPEGEEAVNNNAASQPPTYQEITTLKINGVADDNLAISRFVAALRDSGVFEQVDLRSSVGARVDEGRAQSFLVECTLVDGSPRTTSRPSLGLVRRF